MAAVDGSAWRARGTERFFAVASTPAGAGIRRGSLSLRLCAVRHDVYVFDAFERSHRIGRSYEVAFAPDGGTVCALGRNVVLWETRRKRRVASAHPLSHPSYASFSPNGNVLAIKSTGGEVVILDASDLSMRHRLGGEDFGEGCEVFIDAASQFVIDGAWSGALLVRSLNDGAVIWDERWDGMAKAIATTPDRQTFAYALSDRQSGTTSIYVRPWPFDRHQGRLVAEMGQEDCHCLALSPDGTRIAAITNSALGVWSCATGGSAAVAIPMVDIGRGLAWHPTDDRLAVAAGPQVFLLDASLAQVWRVAVPYASSVEFSTDGSLLAVGAWEEGFVGVLR